MRAQKEQCLQADGGDHDPDNLVTLCGAHHRAIHEGALRIVKGEKHGWAFEHADGTPYGSAPSAASSLVQTRAFQALRGLGFGEREVRRALAEARRELAADAPLESLLRDCIKRLTARTRQRAS